MLHSGGGQTSSYLSIKLLLRLLWFLLVCFAYTHHIRNNQLTERSTANQNPCKSKSRKCWTPTVKVLSSRHNINLIQRDRILCNTDNFLFCLSFFLSLCGTEQWFRASPRLHLITAGRGSSWLQQSQANIVIGNWWMDVWKLMGEHF